MINRWTTSPTTTAEYDDLLLSCKGTVGKIAFLKESSAHIARQIMAIKISNLANKFYIKFFIEKNVQNLKSQAKSMIPGISRNNLLILPLPLPPLSEQKRIVEKLEEILPLVERYGELEQRLTKLDKEFPDKLKKSLLQQAIQGKLTEQLTTDGNAKDLLEKIRAEKSKLISEGKIKKEKPLPPIKAEEIPFDIPDNWQWVHIPNIAFFQEGPGILGKDFRLQGIPLIRISGMKTSTVTLDGCNYLDFDMVEQRWKHFKLDYGDVLISTSASMDKIAEVDEKAIMLHEI